MRSAPASRCSSRGRWTGFPSAIVAVRADRPKVTGEAAARRGAAVQTSPAAVVIVRVADPIARAANPRASHG